MYLEEWCLSKKCVMTHKYSWAAIVGSHSCSFDWHYTVCGTILRHYYLNWSPVLRSVAQTSCSKDVNCSNYFINVPDDSSLSKSSWLLHVRVLSRHGTCAISRSNFSEHYLTCSQRTVYVHSTNCVLTIRDVLISQNVLYALNVRIRYSQFSSKHYF